MKPLIGHYSVYGKAKKNNSEAILKNSKAILKTEKNKRTGRIKQMDKICNSSEHESKCSVKN